MNNIKLQNYSHYKLPITLNPLDYGKLIHQDNNIYILQNESTRNVFKIKVTEKNNNYIELYRKGDLILSWTDVRKDTDIFVRYILNNKFTFKDNVLLSTELKINVQYIMIYNNNNLIEYQDSNAIQVNSDIITPFLLIIILFMMWDLTQNHTDLALALVPLQTGNIIKLRKAKTKNVWNEIILNFDKNIFTKTLFELKFNKFWSDIQSEFKGNNHMFILFKIKYVDNKFATIGTLQRLNVIDKNWYIDFIIENMKDKSEYYNETLIKSIILSYGFKSGKIKNKENIESNINFMELNEMNFPISTNPEDYGKIVKTVNIENGILFVIIDSKGYIITFSKFNQYNEIEYTKNNISQIKFIDEFINKNKFVRILGNKKYYFENNLQILFSKEIKTKFISKTKKSKNITNKFLTLDLETYIKDFELIVYCISIFDGTNKTSFFLSDYKNSEELIITALKSIMIRKYNGYKVYIHNMASFDIIFLFKYLAKLELIKPIIHNDRIISIDFYFDNKYKITFKDSYLILLKSLRELSIAFKVENPKSIFPHFFINENNLNYEGKVPDLKYFIGVNLTEYNEYKSNFNNNWNLKNEAIKYCQLDCISLYQILFKFNELIFCEFNKNIHYYPTLPSLAFAIYRSNFMEEENIPQLSGKIADDIRSGYTGGSCDVFIPESKQGIKIKCLDVNSLYPYIMKSKEMPIGTPTYFKGDITKIKSNSFGFFYCKIEAPNNILHPILQTHVKTDGGTRTISPIGIWFDMLFSEELYNALKYGYKIEILWGYTFEKSYIFKDYVDFLYSLRRKYDKNNAMNYIAKILLNSLYGRFGMDDNFASISVIHKDYYPDFENKYSDNIIEKIELGDYWLVRYTSNDSSEDISSHNVSIGVAAAITAYSRIHMSQFKNNPKINLYYTDTDSIYTDSEVDPDLISDSILGKLKLENTCQKAIFLTPKVYCLLTESDETIYKAKGLKHEVELTMEDF